jgi:pimeloyl-ACP methyl ester carboxylesterase
MGFWVSRVVIGLVGLIVALLLVAFVGEMLAEARDAQAYPPPGRRVDAGDTQLHIHCLGTGRPTVLLDSASFDTVSDWVWVQAQISPTTQVCAYDRAGLGWSDSAAAPPDAQQNTRQLHTLLQNAALPGPYVLVGHSLGGLYVRGYAAQYPDTVAGMVLIEGTHPDFLARQGQPDVLPNADGQMMAAGPVVARFGLLRVLTFAPADPDLPPQQQAELRAYYASAKFADQALALYRAFPALLAQVREAGPLGATPLIIVLGTASGNADGLLGQLQAEQAALSTNSRTRLIDGATHGGLVRNEPYARQTSAAILQVVDAARTGQPLPR